MATGRDMRASLRIQLRDNASPGLDRIEGRLHRIQNAARRIAMVGAAFAALSFAGPVQSAAQLEGSLRGIAVTAGETNAGVTNMVASMRVRVQAWALQFGRSTTEVVGAMDTLTARGIEAADQEWLTPMLARFSAASNTSMDDLAQLSVALTRIAGIQGPEQMQQALTELFRAGQLGGFELRNMARYLPSTLAQFNALEMTGMNVVRAAGAGMQIVRDAAGTTEESAAAFNQLVGHLMSDATIRRMGEYGVNLRQVFTNAIAAQGRDPSVNPFEAIIQHMRRAVGGNMSRVFEIMPDQNSRQALLAMMRQAGRYLEMKREMGRATPGMVRQAEIDMLQGLNAEWRRFTELTTQLGERLGRAVGGALPQVNEALERLRALLADIDERHPGLIDQTVSWGAALLVAFTAVGLLGRGVGMLASGIRLLLWPLAAVFGGILGIIGIKAAIIIGVIAAIAAGAYALWRYWDRVGPWFSDLWDRIKGYFTGFVDWLTGWASTAYEGAVSVIQGIWGVLGTWFGTLWDFWVREPFERFTAWVDGWTNGAMSRVIERIQAAWRGVGTFFDGVWNGIKTGFEAIWGPIMSAIERVERFFNRPPSEGGPGFSEADQETRRGRLGSRGLAGGFYAPEQSMSRTPWNGEIVVRAAPGTEVVETRSSDRRLPISTPDRGMSYGRP